jgi:hypothetical protein
MKNIVSLLLLMLATTNCFSMKKRRHQFEEENKVSKTRPNDFFVDQTPSIPLNDQKDIKKGERKRLSNVDNERNQRQCIDHNLNNQNKPGTQIQIFRLRKKEEFQQQQNPPYIIIWSNDGLVPTNK